MAVNLSPVGGVAAQFFDNSGQVLTGGLLYTYLAGTTTPVATYTTNAGTTPHANPIVFNAAGRVPDSGEIWLTDSLLYKFVLKDSNSVQIATWDNIDGINSNFVAYSTQNETATATQGQTTFTLTSVSYQPATNSLAVFVNGSKQILTTNYIETSSTVVTFVDGLNVGDIVQFTTAVATSTNAIIASSVAFTGFKGQDGNVQNLADNDGSDWIGFIANGGTAVARSAQDKMRDAVSVKDFGAVGDGIVDDTIAIQAALDSGNTQIIVPAGTYLVSGLEIKSDSSVRDFIGMGQPIIKLTTGTNKVALLISKFFVTVDNFIFDSTGTKTDGNSTIGISLPSKAYTKFTNLYFKNYSYAGMKIVQCVYLTAINVDVLNCNYGLSFELSGSIPCTAVAVTNAYITGCLRGINLNATDFYLDNVIFEYCGSTSTNDAALYMPGAYGTIRNLYTEANNRNIYSLDSGVSFISPYILAATAADVISYVGTAGNQRGWVTINAAGITAPRIGPDTVAGYDLVIGTNLTAPLAGTSVNFGGQTMQTIKGTATTATWTTVTALSGQSGDGAARLTYRYSIYAGRADLTTGYDSGVILNGVLYSDSGSTPAWLRVNSGNLQVNITGTSYGLSYGCTLTIINAIGA